MTDWGAVTSAEQAWAEYQRLREEVIALRRSFAGIVETAYSPDGLVRVTVDAHGTLTELYLDPRIYRASDSVALSETITATMREAVSAAAVRMTELTRPFLPEGLRTSGDGQDDNAELTFDQVLRQIDRQLGRSEHR
ncbi:MAG: hypothetical protein DLM59_01145 [Pseudonocardiales bacterium]|nr:MAG: hypothetical protein DLM59_01145 [Pseudonocardiales bacterium]